MGDNKKMKMLTMNDKIGISNSMHVEHTHWKTQGALGWT
jgi:hypothetical protein